MRTAAVVVLLLAAIAAPASARAPEPTKPIEIDRFVGRWYEILRTPNAAQGDCGLSSQHWAEVAPGRLAIQQRCERLGGRGERRVETGARVLDPPKNTKFEASFFGGLIRREYWVLDRSEDYEWMIASTAGGDYVSLLARRPGIAAADVALLKNRIVALGLKADRLVRVDGHGS